jgi:glutathione S-transferase
MVESLAICLFVADAASDMGLAPGPMHTDRASYLQWMVYASATLEPKLTAPFMRSLSVDERDRSGVATPEERAAFEAVLGPLGEGMERGHVLPGGFSAADVLVGSQLYWASQLGLLAQAQTARGYLATMMARPACQRALQHDLG